MDLVTESSVANYVENNTVTTSQITKDIDEENASDSNIPSEEAVLKAISFTVI